MDMTSRRAGALLVVLASTFSWGCGTSDSTSGAGTDTYVMPTGEPIQAEALKWTWVPFDGAKCRDGSTAGIAVSPNPDSDKLMIFFEGGGACYNALTCATNPSNYDSSGVSGITGGVLDRTQAENPVKDWNMVYVPFCSGDVFGGGAQDVTVDGVTGPQQFMGFKNTELFLDRIVPTFPHMKQVLDTGVSAGGFGSAVSAELLQRKFPPGTDIVLIDDSGPGMSSDYVPKCLQHNWRTLWNFDHTFLEECGADCPDHDDYSIDWSFHLATKYPSSRGALISSSADPVITIFFGFGANNCTSTGLTPMPGDQFQAGLLDFRTKIQEKTKNFGTFYINNSNTHTWTHADTFYTVTSAGVRLIDWYKDILDGKPAQQVGP